MANYITPPQPATRIIRLPEVRAKVGLSTNTIYRKIKEGDFPRQIKLGLRSSGWYQNEIDTWIETRRSTSETNRA